MKTLLNLGTKWLVGGCGWLAYRTVTRSRDLRYLSVRIGTVGTDIPNRCFLQPDILESIGSQCIVERVSANAASI